MAKPKKPTETNNNNNKVGKGKVTPVQVAFIVDCYLADNNFSNTRTAFRSEASSLISKFTLQEAPKSLLSLGELLDEYIWLKEQKVIIDQEKCVLAQEKSRVHTLFQGMQDLMIAFNSPPNLTTTTAAAAAAANNNTSLTPSSSAPPPSSSAPPNSFLTSSSSGYTAYRTPMMASTSMTQSMKMDHSNISTPIFNSRPPRKRKGSKDVQELPQAPKRYCGPTTSNNLLNDRGINSVAEPNSVSKSRRHNVNRQPPPLQSVSPNFTQGGGVPIQGSSVAKNLFNKPSKSLNCNTAGPKTPPRAVSSPSDKSTSPLDEETSTAKSNDDTTPPETTPTNCTIISSKTIIVSPDKHFSFERNECTFSSPVKINNRQSKREHVKGRLDFDSSDVPTNTEHTTDGDGSTGSTSSESDKEGDIFDMALQNFEEFGADFSLTEFLTDIGMEYDALDYSCPTTAGASSDAVQELQHEENNAELGTSNSQDVIEHSSQVFAGDVSVNGTDSVTSVKSIRKCIRIMSPTKRSRNSSNHDQGSLSA